jgi:hypothetical protein
MQGQWPAMGGCVGLYDGLPHTTSSSSTARMTSQLFPRLPPLQCCHPVTWRLCPHPACILNTTPPLPLPTPKAELLPHQQHALQLLS